MGLLLYTNPFVDDNLKLPKWCPSVYPYTQSVNRVFSGLDPFKYTLKCETIQDILQLPTNTKTYEEMSAQRAENLKKLDGNIYIMYSGGVDSTTAILSFILTWSKLELQRVHVLASINSISEFPEMWNMVCENFNGRIHTSYKHIEEYCEKGYIITGEHGDQVFGSDVIMRIDKLLGQEALNKSWKIYMPFVYDQIFGKEVSKEFIRKYSETIDVCPFPIETCFDWVWWYNFTNKWQHVKYRLLSYKNWNNPKQNHKKIHHFFDTPDWQRWSIDNHDKKIKDDIFSYKFTAKEYIVKHTGYDYLNKTKKGSLRSLWNNKGFYDAIDTDFNYVSEETAMEYLNE